MERRDFIRICAATAAAAPHSLFAAADVKPRFYTRTALVDERGRPLKATGLTAGKNYVFHYPFEGTPCFLIDLGKPTAQNVALRTEDGGAYHWPGGIGPRNAVVAYSAICSHRMTYPTRQISFISYREQAGASKIARPNMIHCCSEHSEYDPAAGAKVMNGPAPQPLCAILLEHDRATDALTAVGTLGGEMFNAFFAKYEMKLALDHGGDRARRRAAVQTVVTELSRYCRQQVRC
jgi:arsenite oxidase small subunit